MPYYPLLGGLLSDSNAETGGHSENVPFRRLLYTGDREIKGRKETVEETNEFLRRMTTHVAVWGFEHTIRGHNKAFEKNMYFPFGCNRATHSKEGRANR